MRLRRLILSLFISFTLFSHLFAQERKLPTVWTDTALQAAIPLDDYPRPQLTREKWLCLNGEWNYLGGENVASTSAPLQPVSFPSDSKRIRVPFSPESLLSGVQKENEKNMWYGRRFTVPAAWKGKQVLLHFEAVHHHATIFINGQRVGSHSGSYEAFSFNISKWLRANENELVVAVEALNDGKTPCGKCGPRGGSYTNFSGIWQTVWLEPVAETHIEDIRITPRLGAQKVDLFVQTQSATKITAEVLDGEKPIAKLTGTSNRNLSISIPHPKSWSPDDPFLYNLRLTLYDNKGKLTDSVKSYFGMRDLDLAKIRGQVRPTLNGKFVMQIGLLDQGYWPDGLLTAPTEAALKYDLELTKKAGFNLIRKHMKTEPRRFYYWADKMGLLVWQDMPAIWYQEQDTAATRSEFRQELAALIHEHYNSPSIIAWVPFNENWGAFDVKEITDWVKQLDPTRLVNGNSGFNNNPSYQEPYGDPGNGDFVDTHIYVGPYNASVPDSNRAASLGEFGGVGLFVRDHMWPVQNDAYAFETSKENLTNRYRYLLECVAQLMNYKGLSVAIYTQTTDVEHEINGLVTYDREVEKMDLEEVMKINLAVIREGSRIND